MTYRSFTTPEIVLDLIVKRFHGPESIPEGKEEELFVFYSFF